MPCGSQNLKTSGPTVIDLDHLECPKYISSQKLPKCHQTLATRRRNQWTPLRTVFCVGPDRCLNMVKYATLSSWLIEGRSQRCRQASWIQQPHHLLDGQQYEAIYQQSIKAGEREQLAWQPDRLRQQGMTRQQPKSQPPTSASWYRPKMEQQGSSNNTQNTGFWSRPAVNNWR